MKKSIKNIVCLLTIMCLVVFCIAACGNGYSGTKDKDSAETNYIKLSDSQKNIENILNPTLNLSYIYELKAEDGKSFDIEALISKSDGSSETDSVCRMLSADQNGEIFMAYSPNYNAELDIGSFMLGFNGGTRYFDLGGTYGLTKYSCLVGNEKIELGSEPVDLLELGFTNDAGESITYLFRLIPIK